MIKLSDNAKKIFQDLYCFQGEKVEDTFKRVSKEFAKSQEDEDDVYAMLEANVWRPNTPVFLNAGKRDKDKVFSACYVVGLEDSMSSIYDIANVARKIFQYGSGIGIPIGRLREKDSYIYESEREKPPEGKSSGPITFMKLYDAVGETTKSGGRVRRAAILCSMPVTHPDVFDFINCKETDGRLANMNLSILVTDDFMRKLKDGVPVPLVSPDGDRRIRDVDPRELWARLADMAHKSADPGVIFIDNINKYNPLIKDFPVDCTNPCGEQPLMPFGCCNLSAINIHKFCVQEKKKWVFDWDNFYKACRRSMRYMDNLIDVMAFPDDRFKDNTQKYRQVGFGMMGLADALFELGLKYDGQEGRKFAADIMKTMTTACVEESAELAKERGTFYNYERYKDDMLKIVREHIGNNKEVMEKVEKYGLRNCQFTTAQPTGTTALSCDCSYGIEPAFGLVFTKNLITGEKMTLVNPIFERKFKNEPWYSETLIEKICSNGGSLKGLHGVPREIKDVFVVAHDIKYKDRIDMQSELQKYCSTSISSTVNLPKETTKDEIYELFVYAYEKGLKGITIYRDGCKKFQPVTFTKEEEELEFKRPNRLNSETFKIETGNGTMYVTVTDDEGKPVEVFLFLGKSGQLLNTFTEALGRLLSLALQNSVPLEKLIKTLLGINSDMSVWHRFEESDARPTQIMSIPDGIAKLLNKYYVGKEIKVHTGGERCPKCSGFMSATEGCFSCVSCGYSKCS